MSTAQELISRNGKLFSLPDLYFRLKSILDDPEFSLNDVTKLLGHDPGMTARLLRLVNSPFFGFAGKIETVSRAVAMLGSQQVHDLVLASSVTQTFAGMSSEVMDMGVFWRNSVYCAAAARLLASNCNVIDSDRLFVAGLLCDIGHLVMYQQLPGAAQESIERARQEDRPLFMVEREILGFDYAHLGGLLAHQWELPRTLRETIEYHVEPMRSEECSLETSIVHIAHVMTTTFRAGGAQDAEELHVDPHAWRITGLSPEQSLAISGEVEQQVSQVADLILPQRRRARA